MTDHAYYLGLDSGGTKTVVVITDELGQVVGRGQDGPSNHQTGKPEEVRSVLRTAISAAMADAALDPDGLVAACLGMAGLDSETDLCAIQAVIAPLELPASLQLVNDVVVAWAGATGVRPGVVISAGTGSIAFGVNKRGQQARSSGWGHIFGDEGSAYAIAREGIQAVLRAYDRRGPETRLMEALCTHFNQENIPNLITQLNLRPLVPAEIAAFARAVGVAGQRGDPVSIGILERAGRELALAVAAVLRQLDMLQEEAEVAPAGSLLLKNELVYAAFAAELVRYAPQARLITPRFDPAVGAALLARRGDPWIQDKTKEQERVSGPVCD